MGIDNQEIKMIKLIADGLTYTEISDKMNVKPSKIENLRKTLISKTKTKNAASLVSFAYRYGLLKV
ncbi:MAG: LuxR family transcriptional regulator [Pedobacter sp.]|nr:MAG: LuxR family transcriptional regulator [Pedobacter sp.]